MSLGVGIMDIKKLCEKMFSDIVYDYENELMRKNKGVVRRTTSKKILSQREVVK